MSNYREHEEVMQGIKNTGKKWDELLAGKDAEKTYAGLYKRFNELNTFFRHENDDTNAKIAELRKNYVGERLEAEIEKVTKPLDEVKTDAVTAAKQEVEELTADKRERYSQMLMDAPTDVQNRLLDVLSVRSDISEVELEGIIPAFFDNYHAMQVLREVGIKNGINITMPSQLDAPAMAANIGNAHDFLIEACEYITEPNRDNIPIQYHAFFTMDTAHPDVIMDPYYKGYAEMLDNVPMLRDVKTAKTGLTPIERVKIDSYFKDVADENTDSTAVLAKVRDVLAAHPEDKELLKLSKYGSLVETAEASNE